MLELLVGLLQFALLGLQFRGQLLRLLEQTFGLHGRLDRIQHDTDRCGQLFQERHLQIGECAQRCQLNNGLDLTFERHRQHDGIARRRPKQSRTDGDHAGRHLRDQHASSVARALADQPLAQLQMRRIAVQHVIRIGGQQLQRGIRAARLHLIDHAMMRTDQGSEFRQQHAAHRGQIALALQHVGEARQIGLEPVLLGIAIGGQSQIADHRIDVVLQFRHFAARFDLH